VTPTGEPEVDRLASEYPGWFIWRRGRDGMLCAYLLSSRPRRVVYGATAAELAEAIDRQAGADG
jgi:hypothetical protein